MPTISNQVLNLPDYQFIEAVAASFETTNEQVFHLIMNPTHLSKYLKKRWTTIEDGSFKILNLRDLKMLGDKATLPGIEYLAHIEELEVPASFRKIDATPLKQLKKLWLDTYQLMEIYVAENEYIELVGGAHRISNLELYCTKSQEKIIRKLYRKIIRTPDLHYRGTFIFPDEPKKLHRFIRKYNWDEGVKIMGYIARFPKMDKGTALNIYWLARPEYYCQFANREEVVAKNNEQLLMTYDLIRDIRQRYLSGFYKNNNIKFNPKKDGKNGNWTNTYPTLEVKTPIPVEMYLPNF